MTEYISRETAIKSTWMILEGMGYPRSENRPLERTVEAVFKSAHAADVVEVVRCRNCKHYDCEDGDQKCVKDAEWSEEDACYYGFIAYHGPEFFCADGERKDGGREDV